jgi:hypothetical protein
MDGGGEQQTTTTSIPEWMRPYAESFMQKSQEVANKPYEAYGGKTVADFNPYQTQGLTAQAMRGLVGSDINRAAGSELQKTLSGGYLNANPYMDQMVQQVQGDLTRSYNESVVPQQNAMRARSGSFGNSGVEQAIGSQANDFTRQLGNVSTQLRGNDYANERSRMQGAIGMSSGVANQDYVDANAVTQAGAGFQGQNQAQLNDQFARWQDAQNYGQRQLDTLGKGLGMNFGSTTTGGQAGGGAGGAIRGGLGGAASGAAIGSIVPGIGTGIGAAVGGGLGALGGK